jgi:hypothetical protein
VKAQPKRPNIAVAVACSSRNPPKSVKPQKPWKTQQLKQNKQDVLLPTLAYQFHSPRYNKNSKQKSPGQKPGLPH